MTSPESERPRLRPLEVFPTSSDSGPMVVIQDPSGLAEEMLVMSPEAFEVVALLDGTRDLEEIREFIHRQRGHRIEAAQIAQMVRTLEKHHYLDSAGFASWRTEVERDYMARTVREMAFAGRAYPADREDAERYVASLLVESGGADEPPLGSAICALVAPHIDLQRGAHGFAAAYTAYARAGTFDVVVILGTGHHAERGRFLISPHAFQTPFGVLPVDQELTGAIRRRYAGDLDGDRLAHRTEHSIEFQTLLLAGVAQRATGTDGTSRSPSIVPILATTFDDLMREGTTPWEYGEVAEFVAALTEAVAQDGRRVLLLAGADFSHVGHRFGDRQAAGDGLAARAEQVDREALECIVGGDAQALFGAVAAHGNATRICSLPSLYTVLAASGATSAELLHYDQAIDDDGGSMVSFASLRLLADASHRGGRRG